MINTLPDNKGKKLKQLTNCAKLSDSREAAKIVRKKKIAKQK